MIQRRTLLAGAFAAPALTAAMAAWTRAVAADAVTPPTVAELMKKPEVLGASLSPDGQRIAILREQRQGEKRVAFVLIVKADDLAAAPRTVVLGDYDPMQVVWANNDRLLVTLAMDHDANGLKIKGVYDGSIENITIYRAMAIGADGSNPVIMVGNRTNAITDSLDLSRIVDMLADDPDNVIMQIWDPGPSQWTLQKVNVNTGVAVRYEAGSKSTYAWDFQNGVPVVRYDSATTRRTAVNIFVRPQGAADWTFYRKVRSDFGELPAEFEIIAASPERDVLWAMELPEGEDAQVIRKFDLRTRTLGEVVARQPGRGVDGMLVDNNQLLVGVRYTEDRTSYQFADKSFQGHFKGMNAFFENKANVFLFDVDDAHNRFLAHVSGPQQAPAYYLYDRKAVRFDVLGDSRPWLGGRLAPMETLKIKARDGLDLTAYLTTPITPATGPLPMVVVPHGGPQVRDQSGYDHLVQALAAQGWLVLQPNYRGSTGYGRAFAEAGHHHWGDAMQWDVEDCVDSLVKAGRADPKRLAILGGSYGGYAALMGGILKPDLYRCVVSRAGPSDLPKTLADVRGQGDAEIYRWWTDLIGDPARDAAMLRAASPALRAAEMKAPVLLFHGTKDPVVDVFASRDMNAALKQAGKAVTYVEVKGEGHGGWKDEHETTWLEQSVAFIAKSFKS
ncbi:dipeptidyl aminopeptidase/acylaminoacyl peptidase [Caulobacter ginsengisoli]|uniref:Dipeptidyl aminopeptidase/acylaminoacyl peptidase n=1 Tax=Caulobacter ginsengisoli TaxID=400775 RepID=A0ABU0ITF2_9CAUL|nr:prolyl oligopeptidase family serine peptidase [Caulobacter ginsengisoli]MDQ0465282.1 dipeptidyl aminopeptidase/acylaminoacyl peptidase [Caulobacter ginsengisoli]